MLQLHNVMGSLEADASFRAASTRGRFSSFNSAILFRSDHDYLFSILVPPDDLYKTSRFVESNLQSEHRKLTKPKGTTLTASSLPEPTRLSRFATECRPHNWQTTSFYHGFVPVQWLTSRIGFFRCGPPESLPCIVNVLPFLVHQLFILRSSSQSALCPNPLAVKALYPILLHYRTALLVSLAPVTVLVLSLKKFEGRRTWRVEEDCFYGRTVLCAFKLLHEYVCRHIWTFKDALPQIFTIRFSVKLLAGSRLLPVAGPLFLQFLVRWSTLLQSDDIRPEGFLSSILLWLVIIVAVVGVGVTVVVVVESSSVVKLLFLIT
ncbi:hypothetical protein Tco_1379343 [Tanacetum coccineum]